MFVENLLFRSVDNAPLVLFRICLGFLLFFESIGAILTGWVKNHLIDPAFTFTFIGFEWLQPLPGNGMYYYYLLMAGSSLLIMTGYYYRVACIGFAILWTAVYLMQKSEYNNHYYLLTLLAFLMAVSPAADDLSLDSKRKNIVKTSCANWYILLFQLQVAIVYIYAGLNKLYPDWINGQYMEVAMNGKKDYPFIGPILTTSFVKYALTYGGIIFDLFIVPCLLFRKTRILAFVILLFFHLSNSVIFQIGIFPYTMIALTIFFFPPEEIRKLFFRNRSVNLTESVIPDSNERKYISYFFALYITIQVLLPTRPLFYPGNSHWSDEGHRLSWRMMLRSKSGTVLYKIKDDTGREWFEDPTNYLTKSQTNALGRQPDLIWQFAQVLKKELAKKKISNPKIYALSQVSLNGRRPMPLIDSTVDLSRVEWNRFYHSEWILPLKED